MIFLSIRHHNHHHHRTTTTTPTNVCQCLCGARRPKRIPKFGLSTMAGMNSPENRVLMLARTAAHHHRRHSHAHLVSEKKTGNGTAESACVFIYKVDPRPTRPTLERTLSHTDSDDVAGARCCCACALSAESNWLVFILF